MGEAKRPWVLWVFLGEAAPAVENRTRKKMHKVAKIWNSPFPKARASVSINKFYAQKGPRGEVL